MRPENRFGRVNVLSHLSPGPKILHPSIGRLTALEPYSGLVLSADFFAPLKAYFWLNVYSYLIILHINNVQMLLKYSIGCKYYRQMV